MTAAGDQPELHQFETRSRSTFSRQEYESYKKQQGQRPEILALIERFYHQLRYGCTVTTCNTKTCRTSRAQTKGAPYRVPTPTTARTLAAFMASLDDPHRCLCPHPPAPKSSPFDTAFATSKGLYSLAETPDEDLDEVLFHAKNNAIASKTGDWYAKAEMEEWLVIQALSDIPIDLQSPKPYSADQKIDTKSFTQKLFNTSRWSLRLALQDQFQDRSMLLGRQSADPDQLNLSGKIALEMAKNVGNSPKANPILPESLSCFEFLALAYSERDFLERLSLEEQSLLENWGDDFIVTTDTDSLRQVLSHPLKLIKHGLSPFPEYYTSLGADNLHMKSAFAHFRSQPLSVIYSEFILLNQVSTLEPGLYLQWLIPSVKSAYLKHGSTDNIPGPAAAHIVSIAIAALLAFARGRIRPADLALWDHFEDFRQRGLVHCTMAHDHNYGSLDNGNAVLAEWVLGYEDPVAQSLMRLVLRVFASYGYGLPQIYGPSRSFQPEDTSDDNSEDRETRWDFQDRLLDFLCPASGPTDLSKSLNQALIQWTHVIFLRDWKGEPQFHWNTDVGATVDFMLWLFSSRAILGVLPLHFIISALIERMDYVEACKDWLNFKLNYSTGHLLSLPWMLRTNARFTMFRSINLCRMVQAHESAETLNSMISRMSPYVKSSYRQLFYKLSKYTETFLVLEIRRDNILRDCFNQLWRRQKKELLRPLKVKMGMDEGEEGVDMGGVQQEFFRLVIAEALDPQYGLFTTDQKTRMTWFQPMSTAPLHQFTLVGLIFGLALYNGITLTVTFPTAFYRKLIGLENTALKHVEDGWPELHSGLSTLLAWSDGKVEDIFMRTYTFSFEALGTVHHIDMQNFPGSGAQSEMDGTQTDSISNESLSTMINAGAENARMVTDDNRARYVKDYVYWLTEKSIAPQFEAFKAGFNLPLHKRALALLNLEDLQTLIEGHHSIDIEGLREATFYDDKYEANHPRIKEFWEIVHDMSDDQHKKLLEFVTASPRVPARGIEEVEFTIQRNGVGDEHLPTSMTCFGRLLLPEYSSKEVMRDKLLLAIENSIGFGTQ